MKVRAAAGEVWTVRSRFAFPGWAGPGMLPALLVGAAALAYFGAGLGSCQLSTLESQDLWAAAQLFRSYRLSADHSPLHFALLDLWLHTGGVSVPLLRLPSAVFVALATSAVFRLSERRFGTVAALWSALLFATNPEVVDQARSLRLYGLGILLAALCIERALALERSERPERPLLGFLGAAVVAVHTHLFLWLWVAPLSVLVAVRAHAALRGDPRRIAVRAAFAACLLASPQILHGFLALVFTHERHAVYLGMSSHFGAYLEEVGQHLLLGELGADWPCPVWLLALASLLPAFGCYALPAEERLGVVVALAPPFVAAYLLSLGSEVEARYLCFALPGLAALSGLGIAKLPRLPSVLVGLPAVVASTVVTFRAYDVPERSWNAVAHELDRARGPADVVAVFPGYWAESFRFYTRVRELVPVTYPIDLDRVLARNGRVRLVIGPGRYFGDIDAYLGEFTERRVLVRQSEDKGLELDDVSWKVPLATSPEHSPETLVLAGLVGSGGYAWSSVPESIHAFEHVRDLLRSGDAAVTGYAPYEPPLPARLLLGERLAGALRPSPAVAEALRAAGVRAVAVSTEHGSLASAAALLERGRIPSLPVASGGNAPAPLVLDLGTERVALLALGTDASTRLPDPKLAALVAQARLRAGPSVGLVVFVPEPANYASTSSSAERERAHRLVQAGADVVVGSGGYAAAPIERFGTAVIAPSLGSLLLPPNLDLMQRQATGIALRIGFETGRPTHVEAVPLTIDDRSRPRLGRRDGVPPAREPGFELFASGLEHAAVSSIGRGARHALAYGSPTPPSAWDDWLARNARSWLPFSSRDTSDEFFDRRFSDGRSFAGLRNVRSLGEPRFALELDAAPGTTLVVDFPPVALGRRLGVAYALADDREQSKSRPLLDELVSVAVEDGPVWSEAMPFRAGWHGVDLDTSDCARSPRRVTVSLAAPASHFPVAFVLDSEP